MNIRFPEHPRARILLQIVAFAAAAAWILYAFHSYLPAVFTLHSLSTAFSMHPLGLWLRRTGVFDVFLISWFAAAAFCLGKRFLRLIGVTPAAGAEEIAFSIAAGAMLFSWSTFALSLVHGLYRPVAYTLLLIPTAIWGRELKRMPIFIWNFLACKAKSLSSAKGIGICFLAVYVILVLEVILVSALGPSFEYDDLVYHLAGPKNFILAHKLVALPDVPLVFFPKNIEMLHTFGMLLHNDIVSKLLVYLCGCITMLGVYGFMTRFVSRATGMTAVAILASSPLFIWEMRTAHNDIGLTLFLFAGTYATIVWLRTREVQWFRLACVFLAFSLGAKYWAILALGIVVALVFFTMLLKSRAVKPAFSAALKLGLYSSLGLLPWGLVNLYYTGNPVFPLLNDIFRSPYWTSGHTEMALGEMFQGGIRITFANLWDLLRLPWEMMIDPRARFGGNIGPWYVIFIPFLFFFPAMGIELGLLFAAGMLYYTGWAVSGPWVRFLLPALPCLAAGAAFAVVKLLKLLSSFRRIAAVLGAVLLSILGMMASPFFEAQGSWSRYGNSPISTLPIKYLLGEESRNEYLRRFYRGYRAVEYLNRIPGEKKVLYVHTLPDGFHLNGKAAFHYSPYVPGLVGADADHIHKILRQNGITHIVVEQPNQESSPMSSRESEFNHRYLRKLYQRNTSIVYELLSNRIDQTVVMYDFMDHLDETAAVRIQAGKPGSAIKGVRAVDDDSRYTMITAPPAGVEFLVTVPEQATLRFAAAREDPGYTGRGSLQVWVATSESERRMVYNRDLVGNIRSWTEHQVDLSEYAGRRVAIMFRTVESSPCCNYFWADPVLTAPSNPIRSSEAQESFVQDPQERPIVLSGKVTPAKARIGQEYEMSFSGIRLTSETYFDIRYKPPNTAVEQITVNWQYGASLRHLIDPSTAPGKWIITGVRAHYRSYYTKGDFDPVRITVEVTR
jgi:hypothetical protein